MAGLVLVYGQTMSKVKLPTLLLFLGLLYLFLIVHSMRGLPWKQVYEVAGTHPGIVGSEPSFHCTRPNP